MKYWFMCILVGFCCCHDCYWEFNDRYLYENGAIAEIDSVDSSLRYLVTERVLNFAQDDNYIIVYQIPTFGERYRAMRESAPIEYKDSLNDQYNMMKEIHHCYWIIQKKDSRVWGPMNYGDFSRLCKKLRVKTNLNPKYEQKLSTSDFQQI